MTKSILNFNGGLDSTYALWKILSQTDDEVTALTYNFSDEAPETVTLLNDTPMQDKLQKINAMVSWLKAHVRDFNHVVIDYDPNDLNDVINFGELIFRKTTEAYLVKYAVQNDYDKVISTFEKENDGFSASGGSYAPIDAVRRPVSGDAKGIFKRIAAKGEISFMLMDMNYHQAYAFRELPTSLIDMTRSCDAETQDPCGVCFKCSKRKFFLQCIAEGKSNSEIQSIINSESITQDGKWISMKFWLRDYVQTYKSFSGKNEEIDQVYNKEKQVWSMPLWPTSFKF
jgi:7-cyano-7-deazaguanine synthase in queuosine biosynthesis